MSRQWLGQLNRWAPYALTPLVVVAALPAIGPGPWVTLTVAGLTMGVMLFMVASGLTLIFGLMDVLNFAHAAFVTVGAYIAVTVLRPLAGWTNELSLTLNLAALLVALAAAAARQRRARLCLRARHHSTGLWRAAAPDPDHDRCSDRHRATGHRDLGAAGPAAAEACHVARQHFHRLVVDRNLSAVRAVRRSGSCAWRCIFS